MACNILLRNLKFPRTCDEWHSISTNLRLRMKEIFLYCSTIWKQTCLCLWCLKPSLIIFPQKFFPFSKYSARKFIESELVSGKINFHYFLQAFIIFTHTYIHTYIHNTYIHTYIHSSYILIIKANNMHDFSTLLW